MRIISLIGAVAATLAGVTPAAAIYLDTSNVLVHVDESSPGVFDFSQSAFDGGAAVTGSFTGTDLDADGKLSSFLGEVTDFSASFAGNARVPAFTLGFSDLFGLVYDLNGGPFLGDGTMGVSEGILAVGAAIYAAGAGPLGGTACDGTNVCGLVATAVPEPGTWLTMVLGLAGVGAALRLGRRSGPAMVARRLPD